MTNPSNFGKLTGRLAQEVKSFDNKDGSKKLLITLAVEDNFKSGPDKKVQTNFIQIESFVGAGNSAGGWDRVHKGDLIEVFFRVDAKPYTDGDGKTVYPNKLVVEGFPTFLEPKSVTEKRAAENAVKGAQSEAVDPAAAHIAALEAEIAAARAGVNYESTDPFGN
ncbi:MAG TPA: single-stranded DNA-binding protein [Candidatus Lumbricidophila sp.]|nr:single-stranded DNA-binding protein [Candidatus Lumbricidophila sp.]